MRRARTIDYKSVDVMETKSRQKKQDLISYPRIIGGTAALIAGSLILYKYLK